jgi:hypothetical protein
MMADRQLLDRARNQRARSLPDGEGSGHTTT